MDTGGVVQDSWCPAVDPRIMLLQVYDVDQSAANHVLGVLLGELGVERIGDTLVRRSIQRHVTAVWCSHPMRVWCNWAIGRQGSPLSQDQRDALAGAFALGASPEQWAAMAVSFLFPDGAP